MVPSLPKTALMEQVLQLEFAITRMRFLLNA